MKDNLIFTIFGGTGDLTFRKLLPAFYNMEMTKGETLCTRIVIVGRRDYTSESYRLLAKDWVEKFARLRFKEEVYQRLAERILYYRMDFTDETAYAGLDAFTQTLGQGQRIFYFAVAPRFFPVIVKGLQQVRGAREGKVVLEKPFGENLEAAKELNEAMERFFTPERIYRIDHYLGKEMVRNIQTIRFANPIFSNVWDSAHIACIQISAMEEVGVETRGGYYDHSGALKDMMQNHLFQILSIVAMEKPENREPEAMHKEQMKVLHSLTLPENRKDSMVLGQYEGYRTEPSVNPASETETYAAVQLFVDNDRWRGMPFYIRTGKKMKNREMQVAVIFRPPAPGVEPDILNIRIQPTEGIYLQFNIKRPGESEEIIQAKMDFCQSCVLEHHVNTPEAYERLIGACIRGERSWFSQWDQVETSWRFVDAMRDDYRQNRLPVYPYKPGTGGPKEAEELPEKYGYAWFEHEENNR